MYKYFKKLFIVLLCGLVGITSNIVSAKALGEERFSIEGYEYYIYETDNLRTVEVYDIEKDITNVIVYNKTNNKLTIDGNEELVRVNITRPSLIDPSIATLYSAYTRYGPYTTTFEAIFQTIGLLAGTILAIAAVASAVALVGISTAVFTMAIKDIYNYFDKINDVTDFAGDLITGVFTYYQDIQTGTGQARYANRSVKYKFPTTAYRSYSFGNGAWFGTTRPGY